MEKAGYTYYQWKIIGMSICILFVDGIHMNITNNLFFALKKLYNIDDITFSFVSSILFIGVALGSIISGYVSERLGRKHSVTFSNLFMFVFSLCMAYSNNYILFTIFRFLIGIILGLIIPMLFGIVTEYLPIKYRGFVLTFVWTGFSLGHIYTLILMFFFTPNYDLGGIRTVLICCAIPFLVVSLILFVFFEESPRFLIIENKEEEGLYLLEKIAGRSLSKEEKDQICSEVKEGVNKELKVSIKYLFHHEYLKTSIILIFIWIINSYFLYGGMFTLQQTLTKISKIPHVQPKDVIMSQIMISIIVLPGNLISGILTEIKYFGRIFSCIFFYLFSSLFLIAAVIFRQQFSLLYGLTILCLSSAFNISSTYTSELYPTIIRDTALGFFYFWTRISGFSSQFIATGLENSMFLLQYYVMILSSLIAAVIIYFSPIETYGNPIDLPVVHGHFVHENPKSFEENKEKII